MKYLPEFTDKEVMDNHKVVSSRNDMFKEKGLDFFENRKFILKKIGNLDGNILEIGTGKGITAVFLAGKGYKLVSVDKNEEMLKIADILWERIKKANVKAKTLTLKFKYSDFEQHTRSKTISGYFLTQNELISGSEKLLKWEGGFSKGIRLLGLTVSNFSHNEIQKPVQLTLEF